MKVKVDEAGVVQVTPLTKMPLGEFADRLKKLEHKRDRKREAEEKHQNGFQRRMVKLSTLEDDDEIDDHVMARSVDLRM